MNQKLSPERIADACQTLIKEETQPFVGNFPDRIQLAKLFDITESKAYRVMRILYERNVIICRRATPKNGFVIK